VKAITRRRVKLGTGNGPPAANRWGSGCLVLFFFVFFAMGCLFLWFMFLTPAYQMVQATQWQQTPCRIISSEVKTHRGSDGNTYSIHIVYSYEFDGQLYESDRYKFADWSSSGWGGKQKVVNRYPPGAVAECYVNPAEPSQAVIHRGFSTDMFFGVIPLVFIAVGLSGMIWGPRLATSRPRTTSGTREDWLPRPAGITEAEQGNDDRPTKTAGPVILQSKSSPLGNLMAALIVGLFWNGLVSVFVWKAVSDFRQGNADWFLVIFLIPFVAIGIGIMLAAVYSFLALFNPRPELMLGSAMVPLGGTVEVSWRFRGNTGSIRRLYIYLRGQEEAHYRRGTKSYTDTEEFARITLADTTRLIDIPEGKALATLPEDTMHSFATDSNKIVWTLHVTGEIQWWPDVKQDYPLVVLPKSMDGGADRWTN
jgi:hypothetical protein